MSQDPRVSNFWFLRLRCEIGVMPPQKTDNSNVTLGTWSRAEPFARPFYTRLTLCSHYENLRHDAHHKTRRSREVLAKASGREG